jgi:hypothetical protein
MWREYKSLNDAHINIIAQIKRAPGRIQFKFASTQAASTPELFLFLRRSYMKQYIRMDPQRQQRRP